jgi:Icc-related predicted phosphoesterase
MIIDCIGCLHGARPELDGGDLLILTGDYTASDTAIEWDDFDSWLVRLPYRKKILIAGNHDNGLEKEKPRKYLEGIINRKIERFEYLKDSGTEFEGLKIWGSPWTSRFEGINPKTCAFTGADDKEIAPKFELIPSDVDILITHGPPFTIRDAIYNGSQVGSPALMAHHLSRLRPKLWAFSHIHEGYGQDGPYAWSGTRYVNCSIMNEKYKPVNAPIRIVLGDKDLPKRS